MKAIKLTYAEPRYPDLEAKVLIFTTTRVIAIDTFMEEIHRQAKGIYRPRQRHIESNTPRPPATFRLEDAMYGGKTEPSEEEKRRLG